MYLVSISHIIKREPLVWSLDIKEFKFGRQTLCLDAFYYVIEE